MINTSSNIVSLKQDQDLSDAVHLSIETVRSALQKNYNFDSKPSEIVAKDHHVTFLKFFDDSICEVYPVFTINQLNDLYIISQTKFDELEEKQGLFSGCMVNGEKLTKSYYRGVQNGVRLLFLSLWVNKAILLPYEFGLPGGEWHFDNRFRHLFYSEISAAARNENTRFNSNITHPTEEARGMQNARSGYWYKMILTSTWYTAEEVELNEILQFVTVGITKSKYQVHLFVELLENLFGEALKFSKSDFTSARTEKYYSEGKVGHATKELNASGDIELQQHFKGKYRHKVTKVNKVTKATLSNEDKLNRVIESLKGKNISSLKEFISNVIDITVTHMGDKDNVLSNIYVNSIPEQYHGSINYWLDIQKTFLKKKKYESESSGFQALGWFNIYLFLYLPWWYEKNTLSVSQPPKYPSTLNTLNGEIFINRWTETSPSLPLDFLSFMDLIRKAKGWQNNTAYGVLISFVVFMRWCEHKKRRLQDANEFINLIETDDLPRPTKYRQSQKTPLTRRLFKLFIRYCYALENIQCQLIDKVEKGAISVEHLKQLGGQGANYIHLSNSPIKGAMDINEPCRLLQPRLINIDTFGIKIPTISIEGLKGELRIRGFYRFFAHDEYEVNGEVKTLIYPGDLIIMLLTLETGIRGIHLKWLDLDTFDIRVDHSNLGSYLHPLTVNTDKVKTEPWVSTVSANTIKLCLKQKIWRQNISNNSFNYKVYYQGNENSKFGSFRCLFAKNTESGSPTTQLDECWLALLKSFNQFLIDNNLREEPMYKIRPVNSNYYGEINRAAIKTDFTKTGHEFTPLTYVKRSTIHASRVSVVKERTRYLPENIVGKCFTGQNESIVSYYNLIDPEDHYENQNLQWADKDRSSEVNVPIVDEGNINTTRGCAMDKGIAQDVEQALKAYGLINISLYTDSDGNIEDGISLLRSKNDLQLGPNPTHFCPFGNKCTKEVLETHEYDKACAICAYAISGIDHLPAISAAKDAAREKSIENKEVLKRVRDLNPPDLDMINEVDELVNRYAIEAEAWEYRENDLNKKVEGIRKGFDQGEFSVGKPEFICKLYERVQFDKNDHQVSYLIKRLKDCKALPLLETKSIRAKFELGKRKLKACKNPRELLNFDTTHNPAKELYSLIHSYKSVYGISDNTIFKLLEMSPEAIMKLDGRVHPLLSVKEDCNE